MKHLKVQSGQLKGKNIPAVATSGNKENFTPALLKKTVFSLIENFQLTGDLEKSESVFVDLFAGSGQMGFEAISRGFSSALLFELDSNRFSALAQGIARNMNDKIILYKRDSFRFYKTALSQKEKNIVFFADPPYSFWESRKSELRLLAENIISRNEKKIILIFQSQLNPDWNNFTSRKYGNHYLIMHSWLDISQ